MASVTAFIFVDKIDTVLEHVLISKINETSMRAIIAMKILGPR